MIEGEIGKPSGTHLFPAVDELVAPIFREISLHQVFRREGCWARRGMAKRLRGDEERRPKERASRARERDGHARGRMRKKERLRDKERQAEERAGRATGFANERAATREGEAARKRGLGNEGSQW